MKTVTLEEFRAQVDRFLAETEHEDILVTNQGRPWVVLHSAPAEEEAPASEFWEMIRSRRAEPGVPWDEARRALDLDDPE